MASLLLCPPPSGQALKVTLDAAAEGRVYEGHGAVSAGASSRLLMDYPEPQRSEILDYLFTPGYGAALQHLKVEIGGAVNAGGGTEPTHMLTASEQNYHRGYEWWLMKEARVRNPEIILDCLAWGAPGWIGEGNYWSQDMADYVANFLHAARRIHHLDIAYTGVRNEVLNNPDWILTLRDTLDARGLPQVRIVAGDEWNGTWHIVDELRANPALSNAVHAVGAHYPSHQGHGSPTTAQALDQPLWGSEEGIGGASWSTALSLARLYNRNYILGKITKNEIWSPVTAYYDILAAAGSGLMRANQPWSGAYEVSPAIWATAHTTQFSQPGWTYLEGGASALLPGGGSLVTLKSDNGSDYSMVVETSDASAAQAITFQVTNGLSTAALRVWKTSQTSVFSPVGTVVPSGGVYSYTFDPWCIYSLSTVGGQGRGSGASPPTSAFPLPYVDDFESTSPGSTPRYLSDQAGTFEVVARRDGRGQCLRQVLPRAGIRWAAEWNPYTVAGDRNWRDYEIHADVMIETNGFVMLLGRIVDVPGFSDAVPRGYVLAVSDPPGRWEIRDQDRVLASGDIAFAADVWHRLRLTFTGRSIRAYVDGDLVGEVTDGTYPSGMAAVGSGWHHARFDNLSIFPRHRGPRDLAPLANASASTVWPSGATYDAAKACDDDAATRWSAAWPHQPQEWVELDFGTAVRYNRSTLVQFADHVNGFRIQHWDGVDWANDVVGGSLGTARGDAFPIVTTTRARLLFDDMRASPSIYEFKLYQDFDAPNRSPGAAAHASSVWQNDGTYAAHRAGDGDPTTRWSAGAEDGATPWLELDFGTPLTFNKTVVREFSRRITGYQIQVWLTDTWVSVATGDTVGAARINLFPPVTTSRVRFQVTEASNIPSIVELEVYYDLTGSAPVVVNEWMALNQGTLPDPADGQYASWFELYNPGWQALDLSGYYLSASRDTPFQFRIPAGTVLDPGGFLLVWADNQPAQNRPGTDLHVNFGLADAEVIGVFTPNGSQVDVVELRSPAADRSHGSVPDGTFRILRTARPTPGRSNSQVRVTSMEPGSAPDTWELRFAGLPDEIHRVETSTNLADVTWTEVGRVTAHPDGRFEFGEASPDPAARRAFRANTP